MLQYDLKKLKDIAVDFNKLTGIMIVLYDEQFNCLYSYPPKMTPLCGKLRKSKRITKECLDCDQNALQYCQKYKELKVYRCHFGLSEAVVPIIEGDTPIGYLMLGGVVSEIDREQIAENIRNMPNDPNLDKAELLMLLSETPSATRDTLVAAANIMEMCACYLASKDIVHTQHTALHVSIDRYIKENLDSSELSLNDICKHFSVSRSTLYTVSTQGFGMGISDYIRHCRIEHAKKLLLKNNMSIAQISAACGFSAPNRFTKTFKQMVGILPKNYIHQANIQR